MMEYANDHSQLRDSYTEIVRAYTELMDEVMPHLTPAKQVVYQRLFRLSHVRQNPFTKCRYEDLVAQCGLSLRTLQRALKGVRQKRLVSTVWQSHGATTFTIRLVSELPQQSAFLPRHRHGSRPLLSTPTMRPPVYDAFTSEDRDLFLACKRGMSPQRLNELAEEAVDWLTEQAGGDPNVFSDEALRDKVDELVFRAVFGVDRLARYEHVFDHLYRVDTLALNERPPT